MKLQVPLFRPEYKEGMLYGYNDKYENDLLDLLYETTGGYCMYCYSKVEIDSKRFGHLEHAIEKKHCETRLKKCVPNIGLACPKCNQSFKRLGDNDVKIKDVYIESLKNCKCTSNSCKKTCVAYENLKSDYIEKRNIILQPIGVKLGKKELRIQYNLSTFHFEPSSLENYSDAERDFINEHIKKFNLNDSQYRTKELFKFCDDIIHGDKNLRKGKYNNLIVDLLIEQMQDVDIDDLVQFCEMIITLGKMRGKIKWINE